MVDKNMISKSLHEKMIAWRRDLHAHPETAFEEHRTSDVVARALQDMGMEVTRGLATTGLVGTLRNGDGPSLGLRADMDALNMQELGTCDHASTYEGKMHACGHDGHTAMLLGAAQYLSEHKPFRGTIHFIFQPAEENEGGGKYMVQDGLFTRFPCDAVFGLHNAPQMRFGTFSIREGAMLSASDFFEIVVSGNGAHAAHPHTGVDTIVAASSVVGALQGIVSRNLDPLDSLVISVTQIRGGDTWNVLPQETVIRGTCRSFTDKARALAKSRITEVCEGVAITSGARITLNYREGYPATTNAPEPTRQAIRAAQSLVGEENVDTNCKQRMGSEDFAFMQQACPGAYIILGTARGENDPPVHNPYYDFNDDALPLGAAYWIRLAEQFCPL